LIFNLFINYPTLHQLNHTLGLKPEEEDQPLSVNRLDPRGKGKLTRKASAL